MKLFVQDLTELHEIGKALLETTADEVKGKGDRLFVEVIQLPKTKEWIVIKAQAFVAKNK